MTDQEMMIHAIREAQLILARYIDPGDPVKDREQTINNLLAVLDRSDLVEAVDRMEGALGLRWPY